MEFLRNTWDDITLAASGMKFADWVIFIIAGILEVSFVIGIILLCLKI